MKVKDRPLRVLHISTSDIDGGAARAAYRLHQALVSNGIDSQMLVQDKSSDDFRVHTTSANKIQKGLNKLRPILDRVPLYNYKNRTKTSFSTAWFGCNNIVDLINELNPDIVHLHWICNGMITMQNLTKIKAPLVWSLHDMWAFTGGCHYDENCNLYIEKCGSCKVLSSSKENDLSRKIFNRKERAFSQIENLTILGVSKWLTSCSNKSSLLGKKKHITLGNPIDSKLYKPMDKEIARELWNLPKTKKLVLYGAIGGASDPRKGYKELREAMKKLDADDIEFVVFGSSEPEVMEESDFKTHYLGYLKDDISLATLYNAVDLMVVPSLQEAFGQTASESLSCGTPVLAFETTGLVDIVEHKKNGYLAKPFCVSDLKDGINWVLNNPNYSELCYNAREKVLKDFDSMVIANKMIKYYKEIVKGDINV